MIATFDDENLSCHGVSREEVLEVFQSAVSFAFDLDPSQRGNDRAMVIGWTYAGRILEIGIEYFQDEDKEHVFHAMDAGKNYQAEFRRRLGDGG